MFRALRSAVPLLLLLLLAPAQAAGEKVLRVCMTDVPHAPWRMPAEDGLVSGAGLDFDLLKQFEQRSGWTVQRDLASGRRCMVELQLGRFDATVGLSYSEERAAYLRYPMRNQQPDARLALRQDSYSLYHRPGFALQWDGSQLRLPEGVSVDVQSGQSVARDLRQLGATVQERGRQAQQLLQWLKRGESQAVALQTSEAEALRARDPSLSRLVRVQPPLVVKPYFVVFSKRFAQSHEAELPGLW